MRRRGRRAEKKHGTPAMVGAVQMNIYNDNVTTDEDGEATITLPDYFQALNRDFRYQLTVIGQFARAIVSSETNRRRSEATTCIPNCSISRRRRASSGHTIQR
jgi:hypothetical protein